jgi:hypothetical protein
VIGGNALQGQSHQPSGLSIRISFCGNLGLSYDLVESLGRLFLDLAEQDVSGFVSAHLRDAFENLYMFSLRCLELIATIAQVGLPTPQLLFSAVQRLGSTVGRFLSLLQAPITAAGLASPLPNLPFRLVSKLACLPTGLIN